MNPDHGILTTKDGTPLIRLRSKKSIMESRFKLTMRTWDDVWKSTAWAKFAPDKLKQTLHRSSRNQGELKAVDADAAAEGGSAETAQPVTKTKTKSKTKTAPAAGEVQVKKSRFKVVPHVQIDAPPAATPTATSKPQRSSPRPPLSSSSGSSDTDSDRLPAGLPMIESNLNELTMVESELKKLEREHVAKHQLLTPKSDGGSAEKTSLTADDGAVAGDGRKTQHAQQRGDGKKDKSSGPKLASRAAETHSKRLGWLKAFRRKSSADTSSETAPALSAAAAPASQSAAAAKPAKNRHQAAGGAAKSSSTAGGRQSSPRQPQKQRASAANRSRQQQHHGRTSAAVTIVTPVSVLENEGAFLILCLERKKMYRKKVVFLGNALYVLPSETSYFPVGGVSRA